MGLFGLASNADYPYFSGVTGLAGRCKYDVERRTPVVAITGYDTLPPNDLQAALTHLATVGPLAIASDASRWQLYGSGDFCLVRNSWGAVWGEHGYIRLQRESELTCGTD